MTDANLHETTDAVIWAAEFCKRWPSALCQIPGKEGVQDGAEFEATMIGWFANAIMAGVDSRAYLAKAQAGALLRAAAGVSRELWWHPEAECDATFISDAILAIDPDAQAALDRYVKEAVKSDPRVKALVKALELIESITVHSGGEIHGVTAAHWKTAFLMARDEAEAALAAMRAIGGE